MGHDYMPEQLAFDGGAMDLFPANTGSAGPPPNAPPDVVLTTGQVMGYFDGNTVTALWNYAQHYAMSDNSYSTNFGPSTVGAVNLISGQTNGVVKHINGTGGLVGDGNGGLTLIGDPDPLNDVCSGSGTQAQMGGKNIGDLLNAAGITWGWFAGGFNLEKVNPDGSTGCNRQSTSPIVGTQADYVPHHTPFQYYASTAKMCIRDRYRPCRKSPGFSAFRFNAGRIGSTSIKTPSRSARPTAVASRSRRSCRTFLQAQMPAATTNAAVQPTPNPGRSTPRSENVSAKMGSANAYDLTGQNSTFT